LEAYKAFNFGYFQEKSLEGLGFKTLCEMCPPHNKCREPHITEKNTLERYNKNFLIIVERLPD